MSQSSSEAAVRPIDDEDDPALSNLSNTDIDNDEEMMEVDEVEDFSNSLIEAAGDRNDISKIAGSEGHEDHVEAGLSSQGNSKTKRKSDDLIVGLRRGSLKCSGSSNVPSPRQKELHGNYDGPDRLKQSEQPTFAQQNESREFQIFKRESGDSPKLKTNKGQNKLHTDGETHLAYSEIMDPENNSPSNASRQVAMIAISERNHSSKDTDLLSSKVEIKQMDMHSGDNKQGMESRLASGAVRSRDLCSDVEFKNGNKRPAVICNFFAKGWCIKGNSCSFLHVKDDASEASQKPEGEDAATLRKNEGVVLLRDSLLQRENISVGKPASSQHCLNLSREDVVTRSLGQCWSAEEFGQYASLTRRHSQLIGSNLLPEYGDSGRPLNSYHSGNPFSCVSNLEGQSCLRSQYVQNGSLRAQKLLYNDREFHTSRFSSLLRNSPFSSGELEKTSTKVSSNGWEPSVPFRPSFFMTPIGIAPPGSQYDPLRDSVDLPSRGAISFKFSFPSAGASTLNTSCWDYGDSVLSLTVVPDCNGDKSSMSSHNKSHEDVLGKNCHAPGEVLYSGGAEVVGTSAVDGQNGNDPKEDDAAGLLDVKDIKKAEKKVENGVYRQQRDAYRCRKDSKVSRADQNSETDVDSKADGRKDASRKDSKVSRVDQNSETDVDSKADGDACKESKALRQFRAGLVDLVKELLKPAWREGRLSKDSHNTIVRKAVDKVISTLQPHQIPTTMELIQQYLSTSQPKIAKLIEGYVDRYRKS